ncbi:MAG TPA: LamG domain-containing protein [Sedimentisphaerales bacterium]|nr:LamG domain-containing protein [Sedimentisphaerales bacterium]
MCGRKVSCAAFLGLLLSSLVTGGYVAGQEYFPSFADGNTIALWLFDETGYPYATLTDASVYEYDLCLMDAGDLEAGRFGNALRISGSSFSSAYAGFKGAVPIEEMREGDGNPSGEWGPTVAPERILDVLAGEDWTCEFWLKLSSTPGSEVSILDIGDAYEPGVHYNLTGGAGSFEIEDAYAGFEASCPTNSGLLTDGQWHHIAFTYDASLGALVHYVDGAAQAAPVVTGIAVEPTPAVVWPWSLAHDSFGFTASSPLEWRRQNRFNITVGHSRSGAMAMNGLVDEVRLSDTIRYSGSFSLPGSFSRNYGTGPAEPTGPPLLFPAGSPAVIPVPLGSSKHLFIDDVLLESKQGLQTTMNPPGDRQQLNIAVADNSWRPAIFDKDGKVHIFIPDGYSSDEGICRLRWSQDGINFVTPNWGIIDYAGSTNNDFVFYRTPMYGMAFDDLNPNVGTDEMYKITAWVANRGIYMYLSPDGIHWRRNETCILPLVSGGESETFYDDQVGRYVTFLKRDSSFNNEGCSEGGGRRAVSFQTYEVNKAWPFLVRSNPYFEGWPFPAVTCEGPIAMPTTDAGQVYRTRAMKYPWAADAYLAFVWRFPSSEARKVDLGVSRDGENWSFFATSESGPWYIAPYGSYVEAMSLYGMIRRGDELWQYAEYGTGSHGGGSRIYTRLTQRLDGFVSLDAGGTTGTATTLPLIFEGRELALNVSAAGGWVKVGLLDEYGTALAGFDVNDCDTIGADSVEHIVSWNGDSYIGMYSGQVVRVRFEMQNAKLYAFQFGRLCEGAADNPSPADGAEDVAPDAELSWSAGVGAAEHHLFFSTDLNQVSEANLAAWKGALPVEANSYDPCGLLELGTTYYWRIDEVNDGNQVRGDVWSFTTADYIVVDDMESYDDVSNPMYETWVDGCGDANGVGGNGTGSCIEVALMPVHGGGRSMRYSYDNNNPDPPVDGNLSEIERTYSSPQDWTILGVKALTLYFYGDPNNDVEPMYVLLGDDSNEALVVYGAQEAEDTNDVTAGEWHEWNIDLQDFNEGGVDLKEVVRVGIGFGDRANPETGGSGVVYFDDIRLYPRRCLVELAPAGDVTGDCRVNDQDLGAMARDWLIGDEHILRVPHYPTEMQGWYRLDETSDVNVHDSLGGQRDGTIYQDFGTPEPDWRPSEGRFNGCLRFNGIYGVRLLDEGTPAPHLFSDVNEAATVAFWLNAEAASPGEAVVFQAARTGVSGAVVIGIYVDLADGRMRFVTGPSQSESLSIEGPENRIGSWNHYALVKDSTAGIQSVYRNGCLAGRRVDASESMGGVEVCSVGKASAGLYAAYAGKMDDLRIYSYPMSQGNVVYLMGEREWYCPLESPANLYDEEPMLSKRVDFRDFCVLANSWLAESLWP